MQRLNAAKTGNIFALSRRDMQDMTRKSHKAELFRVTFKLFILNSFDGVSIPDIEKATGFTRGTIFHYADTKLDLFRQVVEYYVLDRQDIRKKIQVSEDCTLREFIEAYVEGVERTIDGLWNIIGRDVPKKDCCRAYLNMISQISVLLPELHHTQLAAVVREEKLWTEVIARGMERGELRQDISPEVYAKVFMSLFYGRAFQDSLIEGMDPKLLKLEMEAVYEIIKG